MHFSVGYQFEDKLLSAVQRNIDSISEIYFSFDDFPNGRNPVYTIEKYSKWQALDKQLADFKILNKLNLKFNLLLNGNCYGYIAQSRGFFFKIGDTLDYLKDICNLTCVTTTSPLIAKFIKQNFESIEVRASVNMEIGTAEGMDYISDFFDSFYLKREYNRNLEKIKAARKWCDDNGKKLYGLANSGCLSFCSVHTFHDNLVSHENEISQMDNAYQFEGQCWEYLKRYDKRNNWLRLTNFIRPEDVYLYGDLFEGLKLATRINKNPGIVIDAYCNGSYNGAVTDLLEPSHTRIFYPYVIDNKSIFHGFTEKVMKCSKNCNACKYCSDTQKNATIALE